MSGFYDDPVWAFINVCSGNTGFIYSLWEAASPLFLFSFTRSKMETGWDRDVFGRWGWGGDGDRWDGDGVRKGTKAAGTEWGWGRSDRNGVVIGRLICSHTALYSKFQFHLLKKSNSDAFWYETGYKFKLNALELKDGECLLLTRNLTQLAKHKLQDKKFIKCQNVNYMKFNNTIIKPA